MNQIHQLFTSRAFFFDFGNRPLDSEQLERYREKYIAGVPLLAGRCNRDTISMVSNFHL